MQERPHDPFSPHRPVLAARNITITPLDGDGVPTGEPFTVPEYQTVELAPLEGWPPPVSTTLAEIPPALALLLAPDPEPTAPEPEQPPAPTTPPAARRGGRRSGRRRPRPSAAEVEAAVRKMDR